MARRGSARNAPSNEVVALNTSRELPSDAERTGEDPRIAALPDSHGHAKGEHKAFAEERPIPYTARMLFLWFFHACRRGRPRFMMVADHINYLTFEDPAAVNLVRRALKLAQAGDLYGAAETAGVEVAHAAVVSEGLRRGMRYSIGAEVDNDPRSRPDAQNIVDAMRPDGMVRSVHFLPIVHPQHGEWMWPYDNPEFAELFEVVGVERTWELYMTTLLDAIDKLPGHIVGHFYAPGKFGHWPDEATLESYEDRFLDACAERGMAVEINARYFYKHGPNVDEASLRRYRELHARLLAKAKAKNVAVAVGSDAHSPKDQGRAFDEVLALLDRAEINEIAFPINGRLARVALRATDETRAVATDTSARAASLAAIATDDDEDEPIAGQEAASLPPEPPPEPVAATTAPVRKRPSRAKPKVAPAVTASDAVAMPESEASHAAASAPVAEATPVESLAPEPSGAAAAEATPVETVAPEPSAAASAQPTLAKPVGAKPAAVEPASAEPSAVELLERSPDDAGPTPHRRTARKPTARPPTVPPAPAPAERLAKSAAPAAPAASATKAAPAAKKSPAPKSAPARKPAPASKPPSRAKAAPASKAARPATTAAGTPVTKPRAAAATRKPAATASKPAAKRVPQPPAKPAAAKKAARAATTRTAAKKTAAKAAPARKAAKRTPVAKRTAAKRTAVKKSPAKKSTAKKTGKARR